MRKSAFFASFAFVASLGCGGSSSSGGAPPFPGGSDAGADASGAVSDAGGSTAIPSTAAGQALAWVLAALNGAPVTEADVTAHFTPSFLQAVGGAAQVPAVFTQLAARRTWTLRGFEGATDPDALVAVVTSADGEYWRVSLHTVVAGAGAAMDGLAFELAGDLDPALATLAAVEQAMGGQAATVSLLSATLDGGACTPVETVGASSSLAIGSAFKLWVLAALARDVASGTRGWTDEIAIEDRYKSLPSGTFQDRAAGTKLSLRAFADAMISQSDNTAADHLLFTLGRPAVEAMLATTGHHDPSQNQPFFSTRELFTLKLLLSPQDRSAFVASSTATKRTLLDGYDATLDPRTYAGPPWTTPILPDALEWFATQPDLCKLMASLKAYGDAPATTDVYDVLSINPGFAEHAGAFDYVGFKGGSEPGVLDMTWLLHRKRDSRWLFLGMGWNDTTHAIDEERATYVATAARAIVGR